jgi:hypothetical protein
MAYPVRADYDQALALVALKGISFTLSPDHDTLARMARDIMISDKGYPSDTEVTINGDDPMAMVLVVEGNSWELV